MNIPSIEFKIIKQNYLEAFLDLQLFLLDLIVSQDDVGRQHLFWSSSIDELHAV